MTTKTEIQTKTERPAVTPIEEESTEDVKDRARKPPKDGDEGMTKKPGAPRLSDRDSGRGKMRTDGTRKFESERAYRNRIARHRIRCKEDPRKVKNWNLRRCYGITIEQYDEMVLDQNGRCLGCGQKPDKLFVDHCHSTNRVRGLLCRDCNTVVGLVKEDPHRLIAIARFIKWWKDGDCAFDAKGAGN